MSNKILIIGLLLILFGCEKEGETKIEITSLLPSNVTYNGFQANWKKVEIADFYEIELTTDITFSSIIESNRIADANITYYIFENLEPDKTYYCRVRYNSNNEYSDYSGINSLKTNRNSINFDVIAEDNIKINGNIFKKIVNDEPAPLILFFHQGGQDKSEWLIHPLYNMAVDSGFISASIDFRAHGLSEGTYSPDRTKYPSDIKKVLQYLINLEYVDEERIAVIGASLGAIMATGASSYPEVKAAVALTTYYDAVIELFGDTSLNTVFYIASEYDNSYDSERLYDITSGARKIKIISRSDAHGLRLLESEELTLEVYYWIENCLNNL